MQANVSLIAPKKGRPSLASSPTPLNPLGQQDNVPQFKNPLDQVQLRLILTCALFANQAEEPCIKLCIKLTGKNVFSSK